MMRTLLVTGWGGREGEDRNEEEGDEDVIDRGNEDEDVVGGRKGKGKGSAGSFARSKNVPNVLLKEKNRGQVRFSPPLRHLRVSCCDFDLWGARSGHEP